MSAKKSIPTPAPQATKKPRNRAKHDAPHSAWQVMVHFRMRELERSTRDIAARISTKDRAYGHATVWSWTLNLEGGPPRRTYTADLNRKLAGALDLDPIMLAKAYEESRRVLNLPDVGRSQMGLLGVLRKLFATTQQKTWTREEIVKLIDDLGV